MLAEPKTPKAEDLIIFINTARISNSLF
jgi:hypothetical protein